jgi:hypothetical protein
MLIMPNRKLYVLITYIVLGPQASWALGGRTTCPSLRAGPAFYKRTSEVFGSIFKQGFYLWIWI